ncbi:MAG: DUF1926 domain-containing protein [Treponema sp.]|nr:DUF1926 domain-containing protein [Treponema sp.]
MSNTLEVILCTQGHLPSGTGEADFEGLYAAEIKPLITALAKFPRVHLVIHYSGLLLHWIERRYPELFMLLEDLLNRKQAELLGGGFYHPLLPLIPLADRIGQIEMLSTYLRKQFGKRPLGCWLPSLAWEQNLVGPLTSSGMNYTFLEERHFYGAGLKPGPQGIFEPCLTEDQGKLLIVFPIAEGRRSDLARGLEGLKDLSGNPLVVIPIGGGNLRDRAQGAEVQARYEELFRELSEGDPSITFTTPSKVYKGLGPLRKAYFPTLCLDQNGGGLCCQGRQLLADYPEAGGLYAKMIYVHTLISVKLRGDKARKRTAQEELWKAQDSGVYRLGTENHPGLSSPQVRRAAYRALLEAEKITRDKGKFKPYLSVFDFDLDGEGEYLLQDDKLSLCIKSRGAALIELDYLPGSWNYLDTLSLPTTEGEAPLRRSSFADYLGPPNMAGEDIHPGGIQGGRFCGLEEYQALEVDRLRCRVHFRLPVSSSLPFGDIEIDKTIQLRKNALQVEYVLKNTGTEHRDFSFVPALDLSFSGEGEDHLRIFSVREEDKEGLHLKDAQELHEARTLEFQDLTNEALLSFEASRPFGGRIFNVRAGLPGREEYQWTSLMPLFPLALEGGKTWKLVLTLKISP